MEQHAKEHPDAYFRFDLSEVASKDFDWFKTTY